MSLELAVLRAGLAILSASPNEVASEHVPSLVADLARAQAALLMAASRPLNVLQREPAQPELDRLLGVEEAAAMMGVNPRWLYRHAKILPFARKLSRKVLRFSRAGITRWLTTKRP